VIYPMRRRGLLISKKVLPSST